VNEAVRDIRSTFERHGLGEPPLPTSLAASLVRRDDWLWSTRELDRGALYDPFLFINEATTAVDDYVAIGEVGHGVNSYFLTCQAVVGPLALFVQDGWAGAYMDEADQAAALRGWFAAVVRLLALAEQRSMARRRLTVVVSPAKSWDVCEWVELDGRPFDPAKVSDVGRDPTALDRAEEELLAIAPTDTRAVGTAVEVSVRLDWTPVGEITLRDGDLRFPDGLGRQPALYRFRFVDRAGRWIYVGETEDMARRAHHYERGDRSQRTNASINALMRSHIDGLRRVEMDVALVASLVLGSEPRRQLDLTEKLDRVLAESAAIAAMPREWLVNNNRLGEPGREVIAQDERVGVR
jgi:hypothetical protein